MSYLTLRSTNPQEIQLQTDAKRITYNKVLLIKKNQQTVQLLKVFVRIVIISYETQKKVILKFTCNWSILSECSVFFDSQCILTTSTSQDCVSMSDFYSLELCLSLHLQEYSFLFCIQVLPTAIFKIKESPKILLVFNSSSVLPVTSSCYSASLILITREFKCSNRPSIEVT